MPNFSSYGPSAEGKNDGNHESIAQRLLEASLHAARQGQETCPQRRVCKSLITLGFGFRNRARSCQSDTPFPPLHVSLGHAAALLTHYKRNRNRQ
jgi:hypothetical protein